jgi:hypothetical protein
VSIYATVSDSEPAFFSSVVGWSNVIKWGENLDVSQFESVVHLVEHGFFPNAAELSSQLKQAIQASPPQVSVSKTLIELLELLEGESGEVIIDSGAESDA